MKVYKVLKRQSKKLFSMNKSLSSLLSQRYFTNRPNFPKYKRSKIFAYSNIEDAREVAHKYDGLVYVCEGKISKTTPSIRLYTDMSYKRSGVADFWLGKMKHSFGNTTTAIPRGTVFCDWVRPIKKV